MTQEQFDFSGMATVYGVRCGDGRTISHGAFAHQDGAKVTLVYQHGHKSMNNILGHGYLKSLKHGMRIRAKFNDTEAGRHAKELVKSGDITRLSIYATAIKQRNAFVEHGDIQEVSLVLAGANPGATIDNVIKHSDDEFELPIELDDEIIIHSGEEITIQFEEEDPDPDEDGEDVKHSEEDETLADILATFNDDQKKMLEHLLHAAVKGDNKIEGDIEGDPSMGEVYKSLSEKQRDVVHELVGKVSEDDSDADDADDLQQSDNGDENTMTHNVFEQDPEGGNNSEQAVAAFNQALAHSLSARRGTLRADLEDAAKVLAHAGGTAAGYGIESIDKLFPQAERIDSGDPQFFHEDKTWVAKVMNSVRSVPFSRIRTVYADLTTDTARAHGYITADEKLEDVFEVFDRTTTPQTVYKKQRLDRDDIIDITEFSVVRWIKAEMRMQLREEIAQAILIGDGRNPADADKVKEANIRPILSDDDVYTHKIEVAVTHDVLDLIDEITGCHEHMHGSGDPTLFISTTWLTAMLVVRDNNDRRIYRSEAELREALRVKQIVTVPALKNFQWDPGSGTVDFIAMLVNLRDYTVGAVNAGKTTLFSDFDIDYNQEKYLLETRICGALTTPKAALVISRATS